MENSGHILLLETLEGSRLGELTKFALDRLSLRCLLDIQINSWIYESELGIFLCVCVV